MTTMPLDRSEPATHPSQPLLHLDTLWIQVAGTLCNLRCTHCFVAAGPGENRHALMSRAAVHSWVARGAHLGVKEFYFTGGEPFVHPEITEILADTLAVGPASVLTNGTLFTARRLETLAALARASRFSLEVRVSLDGESAAEHDRLRGPGTFVRALDGLRALEAYGLLPIVTVTQTRDEDPALYRRRLIGMLRANGLARPRLKILPLFLIGREAGRTRGYDAVETLAGLAPGAFDPERLQCGRCRAVTSRGVFVCPLLIDEPRARMGDTLDEALRPFELRHGACHTCWVTGMTCANG